MKIPMKYFKYILIVTCLIFLFYSFYNNINSSNKINNLKQENDSLLNIVFSNKEKLILNQYSKDSLLIELNNIKFQLNEIEKKDSLLVINYNKTIKTFNSLKENITLKELENLMNKRYEKFN